MGKICNMHRGNEKMLSSDINTESNIMLQGGGPGMFYYNSTTHGLQSFRITVETDFNEWEKRSFMQKFLFQYHSFIYIYRVES